MCANLPRPIRYSSRRIGLFQAGEDRHLGLIVHHTDGEREWAYDRKSHVGRLDKALDEAPKRDWVVVDMKKDWRVIYPFQLD